MNPASTPISRWFGSGVPAASKPTCWKPGHADLPIAGEISASDVLEFGTLQGAVANGLGRKAGSIEAGKQAELVVIAAKTPNLIAVTYVAGSGSRSWTDRCRRRPHGRPHFGTIS